MITDHVPRDFTYRGRKYIAGTYRLSRADGWKWWAGVERSAHGISGGVFGRCFYIHRDESRR